MAEMIFTINGKELKAKPITFGDWEFLGNYLKSRLLSDLKMVDDASLRREMQMNIQMQDYSSIDIVNCKRLDVFLKIWHIAFGGNVGMTEEAIRKFIDDEAIWDATKEIFKASGIKYIESEESNENPPPEEKDSPPDESKP